MQIRVPFDELTSYISSHYGKSTNLRYVKSDTVNISTVVDMMFFSKEVGINLTIDKIEDEDLYLSYNNGMGVDLLIKGVLKFLQMSPYGNLVEEKSGNVLVVHLGRVDQMRKLFESMSLNNISFSNDGVVVLASLA